MRQNAEQCCVAQRTDGTSDRLYFGDLRSPADLSLKPAGDTGAAENTDVL